MKGMPTLRRQRDLDTVFQEGNWRRLPQVAVGVLHRGDGEPSRFAFVAGRRIGTAVRRNRSRRRMREALRGLLAQVLPGADIVLAARQETPEVEFTALQQAIRRALDHEGLLACNRREDAR